MGFLSTNGWKVGLGWWFGIDNPFHKGIPNILGILVVPLSNNPFHKGIPNILGVLGGAPK